MMMKNMMMVMKMTAETEERRDPSVVRCKEPMRTLALSYMTATSHIQPFELNYIELKSGL